MNRFKKVLTCMIPIAWIWVVCGLGYALGFGGMPSPKWWEIPYLITALVGGVASLVLTVDILVEMDDE